MDNRELLIKREKYSRDKLHKLSEGLKKIPELKDIHNLTIFGAGSYARLEASEHSDIDMFFLISTSKQRMKDPNTNRIKLFGKVIELVVDEMKFPKFSNDGEYLKILHMSEMIYKMGGQRDDFENHFTTRMLLLLESKCLYGSRVYKNAIAKIVKSYFRDYKKHKTNFKPIFLMNDIMRYWKTLCLNYENRRRDFSKGGEIYTTKQKVKNFKLKYSRMTTCFATIACLSSQLKSIKENDVIDLVKLTPRERLLQLSDRLPSTKTKIDEILNSYIWFLEMTSLPTSEIEEYFANDQKRHDAFKKANDYGDKMFDLLKTIDTDYNIFRYLVI